MKVCPRHWDALKAAIEQRKMGHLISANGRDVVARVSAELRGVAEISDFDPLMHAHNMIMERALQFAQHAGLM